jgi:predicted site-specific integrase-resolvase
MRTKNTWMLRSGEVAKRLGLHPLTVLAPDEDKTPEEELTQGLLAIIASCAGRLYGLRSHTQTQFLACAEQALQAKDGT